MVLVDLLELELDGLDELPALLPENLKGLSHNMDLALMTCMVSFSLNRGRGYFLNFLCAPMILYRVSDPH